MTPPPDVRRVALTGGIASGKSYCLARFAALGVPTIDADALAHDAVAVGAPALGAIARRFGPAVIQADGHLDRDALGRIVFGDATARQDLERIIHPLVYAGIDRWFRAQAAPGCAIADVPLLFETGHAAEFAVVIVAHCRVDQQIERLIARGLSAVEARQRLEAQWPTEDKVRRADFAIDTSGDKAGTDRQVREVWERVCRT